MLRQNDQPHTLNEEEIVTGASLLHASFGYAAAIMGGCHWVHS